MDKLPYMLFGTLLMLVIADMVNAGMLIILGALALVWGFFAYMSEREVR